MNLKKSPPKIEILPEHLIDQIKAGEVLERPASLIKELIENSLDANSTDIKIHLVENGLDLLSIEDNGHGINLENLPFAFLRHATSKLKNYDDLFHLHSFGFRGEALASIAASSRLTCTTQPNDPELEGGKIVIHGGSQELLIPYRLGKCGTSIFVKDLFYNTPARLKFIKSKNSEKAALKKMLNSFLLSNPNVNFSIKWDDKDKETYPTEALPRRIQQVFFSRSSKEESDQMLCAFESHENYSVEIFFSAHPHSTPQYRHHYLFANNRFFQDKSIHQAILRNLDSLWKNGENGHYVVMIKTPSEDIDVNVHPNKTQIKFLKMDIVYSLLITAIRSALRGVVSQNESTTKPVQESIFSREERQDFDLQHFSQTDVFNLASVFESTQQQSSFNHEIIGVIENEILLLKHNDQFYLTDVRQLISQFVCTGISDFCHKDESPAPLLISEPFKVQQGKIDNHLNDLKSLGFELDRLNSEMLALRTFPRFLPQPLHRFVTDQLIIYFNNPKTADFERDHFSEFLVKHAIIERSFSSHLLSTILEPYKIAPSALFKPLTKTALRGILNE